MSSCKVGITVYEIVSECRLFSSCWRKKPYISRVGGDGETWNPISQLQSHALTRLRQSSLSMHKAAMPLLRELVASLSLWGSGLNLRPAYVGFVVDKVEEVYRIFLWVLLFLSHSWSINHSSICDDKMSPVQIIGKESFINVRSLLNQQLKIFFGGDEDSLISQEEESFVSHDYHDKGC